MVPRATVQHQTEAQAASGIEAVDYTGVHRDRIDPGDQRRSGIREPQDDTRNIANQLQRLSQLLGAPAHRWNRRRRGSPRAQQGLFRERGA
ncbi:hypothetical protein QT22_00330 [Staphylococcus aureus]|nr:hypothetical protein QT22_00330 [Staphylococcus aureus]